MEIIKHKGNTRVPCICIVRTAKMVYRGIRIGTISEECSDVREFGWVIKVDWEKAGRPKIAGINEDLRLDEYIRRYIPAFVEERTLPNTRVNLWKELHRLGLRYNDRFEYMCLTHGLCGANEILVERL